MVDYQLFKWFLLVLVGCRGGDGGAGLVVGGYPLLLPSSSYDLLLGCCEHWGSRNEAVPW